MNYLFHNLGRIAGLFFEQFWLCALALAAALLIALPLAWILFDHPRLSRPVLSTLGILYTIPSIALIILLVPTFGLNNTSVFIALVLYCQVLLVRNFLAGLRNIPAEIREAALGMGMNRWQLAFQIEFSLALPVLIAGVRIAAVVTISIATVGAKFGSGGLGVLLFEGISQYRMDKLWIGTLAISILAVGAYSGLKRLESFFARQNSPDVS